MDSDQQTLYNAPCGLAAGVSAPHVSGNFNAETLNTVLAPQVDWDKWVDEDEEDEAAPNKDFDMSDLQNFSNLGGGSFGAGLGGGMSGIGNVEVPSPLLNN